MKKPSFASEKEIQQQLLAVDLETLIIRLEGFAYTLISNTPLKIEPIDLVMDVVLKIQTLERKWYKNKCPDFKRFLFITIKGHFLNEVKKNCNRWEAEDGYTYSFLINQNNHSPDKKLDYNTIKKKSLEELSKLDPTIEEELLFECWIDGITKPNSVADFLEIPVEEIYNATRRLKNKLPSIKKQLKPYFDGR